MRRFPSSPATFRDRAPIQQRLDDFRQQRRVQAGSLIISALAMPFCRVAAASGWAA